MELKTKSNNQLGIFYIVLTALCWSSGGVFLKFVNAGIGTISAVRYITGLIGIILLNRAFPVFSIKNSDGTINKTATIYLWLGGICYAVCSFLYVCANRYTTAANAILLQYTNPVWIIIFGPALLKEKTTKIDLITIAGVIAGMTFFFASELINGLKNINRDIILGDFFAILSGFFLAFYTMIMRKQHDGKSVESSMLSQIIGLAFTFPFLFLCSIPDGKSCLFLVLCGLINGSLALFFYPLGLKRVTALSASLISMLEPLMNPVWVYIFAGERPGFLCIFGGLTILCFVVLRTIVIARRAE